MNQTNQSGKKEILVCDDSEGIRASLKSVLERNFNVTLVGNEAKLFDVLRGNKVFDLMFLDFSLGDANGIDVLIKIRAEFPLIKVIFITGHQDVDLEAEAFHYGACDFIAKPFNGTTILKSLYKNLST